MLVLDANILMPSWVKGCGLYWLSMAREFSSLRQKSHSPKLGGAFRESSSGGAKGG
jgi:hypothetical protein